MHTCTYNDVCTYNVMHMYVLLCVCMYVNDDNHLVFSDHVISKKALNSQ